MDYMMIKKNCIKAETETYKIQNLVPNTSSGFVYAVSFDMFSVSVFVYFPVLVF